MYIELSFRFKFKNNNVQANEDFIDHFICDFVERNGLLCGGGSNMTIFDPKEKKTYDEMKMMLLTYLNTNSKLVSSVVIRSYNEDLDKFLSLEEIFFPHERTGLL